MHPYIAAILRHVELQFKKNPLVRKKIKNYQQLEKEKIYILVSVFIDRANIKGTRQLKMLHTKKTLHNFKSARFLCIAAILRHIEVKFGKFLVSEFRI